MKLAILFSGGKDSCLAHLKAYQAGHQVVCLISMQSENKESYMFHTPNTKWTSLQAQALGIPIIIQQTQGEKEKEIQDLHKAIEKAKDIYEIQGVVTGAVGSTYQSTRIQKVCHQLDLYCFNPLWQKPQLELLQELVDDNFDVRIVGVFAYPLEESWLGRILDKNMIQELAELQKTYKMHPAGEGGEIETFVCDSPLFHRKVRFEQTQSEYENYAGVLHIQQADLEEKQ